MLKDQTDKDWEWFGENNPYYGVVCWDDFDAKSLDKDALDGFFLRGRQYVEEVVDLMDQFFPEGPEKKKAIDFGCGVGRLAIPLAQKYQQVTGVDISPSMLKEAARNAKNHSVANIRYILTGDLKNEPSDVDLVHSFIVMQHIPVEVGERLTRQLIDLLKPGGVGILHFTYRTSDDVSLKSRLLMTAYHKIPMVYRLRSLIKKQPVCQMNEYDLNKIFAILQDTGCGSPQIRFTHHHSVSGVLVFFQKRDAKLLSDMEPEKKCK